MTTKKTTPRLPLSVPPLHCQSVNADHEVVSIEPHWPGMFRFAVHLVEMNLDEGDGKKVVVEMLEFGKRLYERAERTKNETTTGNPDRH